MALALNIGSPGVALVQSGPVVATTGANPVATLPVASTAGNFLFLVVSSDSGVTLSTNPAGWSSSGALTNAHGYVQGFVIYNNLGGISSVTMTGSGSGDWYCHLSEWSGVTGIAADIDLGGVGVSAGADTLSGATSATSGTTLAPTTTANVATTGDLAISAWLQQIAAPGTVTFTTPAGWSRLADNGSSSLVSHLDLEYQINPTTGAAVGPTLTSTGTSVAAGGIVFASGPSGPVVDQTNYLSKVVDPILKFNTFDFALEDPATVPKLGDPVALTTPTWNGHIVKVEIADIVDLPTGHKRVTITANNQDALPVSPPLAPFDLSDVDQSGRLLLEDSSGILLLEDGSGGFLLERTSQPYAQLSVRVSQNFDDTVAVLGSLITYATGLAPGQLFRLYSGNLGYNRIQFEIVNVTTTWIGLQTPAYYVEFGDQFKTGATAGGGILTQ